MVTPTISATNDATSYEIGGTQVTLTCTSTSGSGTCEWKLNGGKMSVDNKHCFLFIDKSNIKLITVLFTEVQLPTLSMLYLIQTPLLLEITPALLQFHLQPVHIALHTP